MRGLRPLIEKLFGRNLVAYRLAHLSDQLTVAALDRPAAASLRLLGVLNVPFKHAPLVK